VKKLRRRLENSSQKHIVMEFQEKSLIKNFLNPQNDGLRDKTVIMRRNVFSGKERCERLGTAVGG